MKVSAKNLVSYQNSKSKKILILNMKGGVGKSTLAVSMATFLTNINIQTELIDLDTQRISYDWGVKNEKLLRAQYYSKNSRVPLSLSIRLCMNTEVTILDSPSNFTIFELERFLSLADKVILPVQCSPIDLHAILGFMKLLMQSSNFKVIYPAFIITRWQDKHNKDIELFQRVLGKLRYPVLGEMTESSGYRDIYIDVLKCSVEEFKRDESLWSELVDWLYD